MDSRQWIVEVCVCSLVCVLCVVFVCVWVLLCVLCNWSGWVQLGRTLAIIVRFSQVAAAGLTFPTHHAWKRVGNRSVSSLGVKFFFCRIH
jgi:hypothetical protein